MAAPYLSPPRRFKQIGSSVRYINPLCEVYCRRKVEWIDQLWLHLHYSVDPQSTPPKKKTFDHSQEGGVNLACATDDLSHYDEI